MSETASGSAYSALASGCAIVDQPQREWLVASGEDCVRFVNGLVTCDVRELEPGEGVYGFFTSSRGRVLSDVVVTAFEQTLRLDLPSGRTRSIADHMLRYKVADRVEVEPVEERARIVVAGPESVRLLERLLNQSLVASEWGYQRLEDGMALQRESRLGVAATRIAGPQEDVDTLAARLEDAGALRVGSDVVSVVRVERGVPWFGVDFGEENFPQETGLESAAVSYTKGCYLGQEIVARIHYRGGVNRKMWGLKGTDFAIEVGSELFFEEETVGRVTSAVSSSALKAPIALATVHKKARETVTLANGSRLQLVELPFIS
jgi:aminomethyltransferase